MRVACATSSMASYFKAHFPEMGVIENVDRVPEDLDLLILTGGEDISPSRYRAEPDGSYGINLDRDEKEFSILDRALILNPSLKVLGVCRGHQLINIFFGGSLIQDIGSHPGIHPLKFRDDADHPLKWLTMVNSMHHQAVNNIGYNGDYSPDIIAVEPSSGLPEILLWGDQFLGVQFHPEFFSFEKGDKFFSCIKSWVKREASFLLTRTDRDIRKILIERGILDFQVIGEDTEND